MGNRFENPTPTYKAKIWTKIWPQNCRVCLLLKHFGSYFVQIFVHDFALYVGRAGVIRAFLTVVVRMASPHHSINAHCSACLASGTCCKAVSEHAKPPATLFQAGNYSAHHQPKQARRRILLGIPNFLTLGIAFGDFPFFLPLAITAFGGHERYFGLAVIALFGASEFIVPKCYYRWGKMGKRSLVSLK